MLQGMNILYENNSLVHYYFPIVQWGRSTKTSVTFPIAFPNNCFTAIGMLVRGSKGEVSMNQPTKTGVQFNSYEDPWNWIAIGN